MLPTTWRHTNGGNVKRDAVRAGPTTCRPCEVPLGTRVRIRDADFGEEAPRPKVPRTIPQPHFSLERRSLVSRQGGVAPVAGWTAEKARRIGEPRLPT
eukprot:10935719-Heterocapsa_arctica.AAC.1